MSSIVVFTVIADELDTTKREAYLRKQKCVSRFSLWEVNRRGGTEVAVKFTCDDQEMRLFGKVLMWPLRL